MASLKLDAFARQLNFGTVDKLTGEAHRLAFANYAAQVRDEEIARQVARGGARPSVETRVDGRLGAALQSVRIGGHIRFDFRYLSEMTLFALAVLRGLAPQDSGAYSESFLALVDNVEIDPHAIPASAREVFVTSRKVYSRKIQVGARGFKAHAGLFDKALKAVRTRYGNITTVEVRFVKLVGGYVLKGRKKRKDTAKGVEMTYPALLFRARF